MLLINPPHIQIKGLYARVVFEPIGLAYVAAYLEREGYSVSILDTIGLGFDQLTEYDGTHEVVGLSYEEIRERIQDYAPHVVGIGIPFTIRAQSAYKIAGIVKDLDSSTKTMVGGIHVTGYPEEVISQPAIDFACLGEGEGPMAEVMDAIVRGAPEEEYANIGGIGYRTKTGKVSMNSRENPVMDLDQLPNPARHLLPYDRYFSAQKVFMTGRYGRRFATVSTSRGCPYTCNFCIIHTLFGRKWRYRTPGHVVDEIQTLKDEFGISTIHFEDDNLTLKKDRTRSLAEMLIERKLNITWDTPNGAMGHTLADEDLLRTIKKSGCKHLSFAPESGDQWAVVNVLKKNIDLTKTEEAVRLCKKVGVKSDAFFVIGSPGETKQMIENTISFAKGLRKMGLNRVHLHIATPFEGTDVYYEAKEKGYLVDAPEGCIRLEAPRIQTPEFTVQEIDQYFLKGGQVNARLPFDKTRLVLHLLFHDPRKLISSGFRYAVKRAAGLSAPAPPH